MNQTDRPISTRGEVEVVDVGLSAEVVVIETGSVGYFEVSSKLKSLGWSALTSLIRSLLVL